MADIIRTITSYLVLPDWRTLMTNPDQLQTASRNRKADRWLTFRGRGI